jgi:hypothetical protein
MNFNRIWKRIKGVQEKLAPRPKTPLALIRKILTNARGEPIEFSEAEMAEIRRYAEMRPNDIRSGCDNMAHSTCVKFLEEYERPATS